MMFTSLNLLWMGKVCAWHDFGRRSSVLGLRGTVPPLQCQTESMANGRLERVSETPSLWDDGEGELDNMKAA